MELDGAVVRCPTDGRIVWVVVRDRVDRTRRGGAQTAHNAPTCERRSSVPYTMQWNGSVIVRSELALR